jgi:hypothetical protein
MRAQALDQTKTTSTDLCLMKVVSAFLCAGRFLALLFSIKRVVLTTSAGAGETISQKVVGSSRARCEQRVALFKLLETTLDFSPVF